MKVAVVTGASSGIGLSISRGLIDNGFKVYGFSRSRPGDADIAHIPCDVTKERDVESAMKQVAQTEGRIDVLVNNAGMGISGAAEYTGSESAKYIFDVNFFGAFYCAKHATGFMRSGGGGKIINVSSVGSVMAIPFQSFYTATKLALNGFFEAFSLEVKPFNIQVCTMMLGDIKTGFTSARRKNAADGEAYGQRIEKSLAVMEKDEQNGLPPEMVSKKVAQLCNKKKLPHYKTVGFKYKTFLVLGKLLPKRLVMFVIDILYGGH